ncbi:MATE family efflux transporter [candidate division GN15 bacterium]|nr:MATE family efflux transporter [candidate division GN15 bacterium]
MSSLAPQRIPTDYTQGSVISAIVKMGLPSMFGFLSENIYRFVDTFWVSRLENGEAAVAAITFFGTMQWMMFSFNSLVGPGSVAVISRRYGEKAYDRAEKAIKETIILKLFFGAVLGTAGYLFVRMILGLLGAEGEALEMGVTYGQTMLLGLPVMFATYSIFTGMRSVANPQMAMMLMVGSNLLNLVLDPLFIFGYAGLPALGIQGAAVASVTSFLITLSVGFVLFYGRRTNVRLTLSGEAPISLQSMLKIVKIGVPAWLGELSFSGSRLVITPMIAAFGTPVVAAYGVGNQVTHFGIMVLVGIGLGLSSLIGHTVGSGKIDRARTVGNTAVWLGIGIMAFFGIVTFAFAPQIMRLFFQDAETVTYGVHMLRILALGFPFLGGFLMMEEIHMGVGLNTPTMIMAIIHGWILQALPMYILTQVMGFNQDAIWWAASGSLFLGCVIFYQYYRRGRWLTHQV